MSWVWALEPVEGQRKDSWRLTWLVIGNSRETESQLTKVVEASPKKLGVSGILSVRHRILDTGWLLTLFTPIYSKQNMF